MHLQISQRRQIGIIRQWSWLVVLAVLCVLATIVVWGFRGSPVHHDHGAGSASSGSVEATTSELGRSAGTGRRSGRSPRLKDYAANVAILPSGYFSPTPVLPNDTYLSEPYSPGKKPPPDDYIVASELDGEIDAAALALNPLEAQWLQDHGYPSLKRLEDTRDMDAAAFAQNARPGSIADQALLGKKQLEDNEVVEGHDNLRTAAARGSTWAMILIGRRAAQHGNKIQAAAWFKMALRRGDWHGANEISTLGDFSGFDQYSAELTALRRYAELETIRARLHMAPFSNSLRPGMTDWRQLDWQKINRDSTIGVYFQPGGG